MIWGNFVKYIVIEETLISYNQPSIIDPKCMMSFHNKNLCKSTQIRFNYSSPITTSLTLNYYDNSYINGDMSTTLKTVSNLNQTANTYTEQIKMQPSQPQNQAESNKQNNIAQTKKKPCSVLIKCKSTQTLHALGEIQIESRLSDLSNSVIDNSICSRQHVRTIQNKSHLINKSEINNQKKHFKLTNFRPKLRKLQFKVTNTNIEDFQIGSVMGKGNFGKVYKARHRLTGFLYALKQIKKSVIKDINQFILGIKGHFFLDHPNLAKLYSCFADQEYIYLVMELCIDGSLEKYKRKISNNNQRDRIIVGIAQGIQYMHSYILRHGDLKLQNILISHGFPKITDFDCIFNGKQKQFQAVRRKSKLWGSPAYFSPDMMKQHTFALADDIWSLGVIMYELYCNFHPFDLHDTKDLNKIVSQQMIPIPNNIKESTKTLIERMLDKNKQTRISLQQILKYH